jgi:hypothetical protein
MSAEARAEAMTRPSWVVLEGLLNAKDEAAAAAGAQRQFFAVVMNPASSVSTNPRP